ncbi:hypothetical protein B0H13DRAFT_2428620, partial [Mycena leptocephala]
YIDDRDSRITYNPAWTQEGSDQDFQHTCSRTSSTGDSFSLKFEGNGISFYGGITSTTINASAVIDGGPPQFFGAPATATTTNNLLFKSPALSAGTHNLVITAQNAEHVWTDYFIVNPDSPSSSPESPPSGGGSPPGTTTSTSTPSQSTPSGGSHPAPASSGTSVSGSTGSHTSPSGSTSSGSFLSGSLSSSNSPSTPSSLDSDTSPSIIASSSAKSPPIAAIVASVVAVMFLIALVAAIFFCRRRCRQKASMLPKVNPLQPAPLPSFAAPGATLEVTYGDGYAAVSTTSGTSAGYLSSDNLLPSTSG